MRPGGAELMAAGGLGLGFRVAGLKENPKPFSWLLARGKWLLGAWVLRAAQQTGPQGAECNQAACLATCLSDSAALANEGDACWLRWLRLCRLQAAASGKQKQHAPVSALFMGPASAQAKPLMHPLRGRDSALDAYAAEAACSAPP